MMRKIIGLVAFASTGAGIMFAVGINDVNPIHMIFLMIVGYFFTLSLVEHYSELKEGE